MSDDGDREELLDTASPHRTDRRLVVALAVVATVLVAIVALHSIDNSPDHAAAPTSSPVPSGSGSSAPQIPAFPSARLTFWPSSEEPDACPRDWVCTPARTPVDVRKTIRTAVGAVFGAARNVHVATRVRHLRGHRRPGVLFTRLIRAETPIGPVTVYVYTSITGGQAEYFPSAGPGDIVTAAGRVDGFDVSIAMRVVHRTASTNARMTRLTRDERLLATA